MDTSLIFDHLEHVEGRPIRDGDKVIHIEDYIETHPENPEQQTAVYTLYSVEFANQDKKAYYVQSLSTSANVIIPANRDIMAEVFPDHLADAGFETDQ